MEYENGGDLQKTSDATVVLTYECCQRGNNRGVGGPTPVVHVFNPPFCPILSSVLTLGAADAPSSFSLIPSLSVVGLSGEFR